MSISAIPYHPTLTPYRTAAPAPSRKVARAMMMGFAMYFAMPYPLALRYSTTDSRMMALRNNAGEGYCR